MSLFAKLKNTKLKSIKFGQTNTLGDSSAPYIVADINDGQNPNNPTSISRYDDGFVRGGSLSAAKLGITDLKRITKFLKNSPNGSSFIKKQIGLQLSNPQLETKQLPQIGGNGFFGQILNFGIRLVNGINDAVGGPTRIYNLGVNTLAQIPLNALGGHIVRHGILPIISEDQKYENVVKYNNKNGNNRLVGYYTTLMTGDKNSDGKPVYSSTSKRTINSYSGGPNSSYGIGRTTIKRYDYSISQQDIKQSLDSIQYKLATASNGNKISLGLNKALYKFFGTTVSKLKPIQITSTPKSTFYDTPLSKLKPGGKETDNTSLSFNKKTTNPPSKNVNIFGFLSDPDNKNLLKLSNTKVEYQPNKKLDGLGSKPNSNINDFIVPRTSNLKYDSLIKKKKQTLDELKLGSAEITNDRTDSNYTYFHKNPNTPSFFKQFERIDADILSVVFSPKNPFTGNTIKECGDLYFSAYIKGYNENHQSNWNDIKYNGRSELFYNFVSYKKTANFKLQIPIFNESELLVKHNLLDNLKKTTAGYYYGNRLGGVITYIKLGAYLDNVPCIINSMNISIPDDASWDWIENENTAYSMLIEVDFSLTVIGNIIPGFVDNTAPKEDNIPTPTPKPAPKPEFKVEKPSISTIKSDASVTKFTPGATNYKGTSATTAAKAIKLKPKKLTSAENKKLVDKLQSKR